MAMAASPPSIGKIRVHEAAYEDTLVDMARAENLGYVEMRAANPDADPWLPGAGTKLVLPQEHLLPDGAREGILINLPDMRLYYFPEKDGIPVSWPIGIGADGLLTPIGSTTVVRKMAGPSWRPTAEKRARDPSVPDVVGPGPDNPLGAYALYLGWPTYLIHGTNKPLGVGRRVSSGCIRMYPEAIEALFAKVAPGTKVMVVNQPVKMAFKGGELFMEAHPSLIQADAVEAQGRFIPEVPEGFMKRVISMAGDAAPRLDWPLVRQVIRERRGYPVKITQSASIGP
ncbi:MAG: hypothetical protein A2018_08245 [Alphaproteobacteria bacterium GWF2_58_20]|nr:MAG: hypothetical protein A2018_08245 [Alphaproteobacteria bacterium GWF2_58_20]